jgi:hypothetical protein
MASSKCERMDRSTEQRATTMSTTLNRAAAAAAVFTSVTAAVGLAPATAVDALDRSRITVRASDYEVRPGEQFILRGRMASEGNPVAGATVRVQSYRADGWEAVRGAVVETGSDGRYRVRVILQSGGDRDLRVVGNPDQDHIRIARAYTVVRVLG